MIAAYRAAAREAIESAEIVERHDMGELTVRFPWLAMNDVMRVLKRSEAQIADQRFDNACEIRLRIRRDHLESLTASLLPIDCRARKKREEEYRRDFEALQNLSGEEYWKAYAEFKQKYIK